MVCRCNATYADRNASWAALRRRRASPPTTAAALLAATARRAPSLRYHRTVGIHPAPPQALGLLVYHRMALKRECAADLDRQCSPCITNCTEGFHRLRECVPTATAVRPEHRSSAGCGQRSGAYACMFGTRPGPHVLALPPRLPGVLGAQRCGMHPLPQRYLPPQWDLRLLLRPLLVPGR
jgi:hypothetical protein